MARQSSENFNRLSRAHKRYRQTDDRRQTTDDRQTDGRTTTNSEHELEFTFANYSAFISICVRSFVGPSGSSIDVASWSRKCTPPPTAEKKIGPNLQRKVVSAPQAERTCTPGKAIVHFLGNWGRSGLWEWLFRQF